jgi:hypothetical protein
LTIAIGTDALLPEQVELALEVVIEVAPDEHCPARSSNLEANPTGRADDGHADPMALSVVDQLLEQLIA